MELETDFDVMSSEKVIPESEGEKEQVVTGVGRKRRRRVGELSGRQMALEKLKREGKTEYRHCHFLTPFGEVVVTLRRVLMEFADGSEDKISTETVGFLPEKRRLDACVADHVCDVNSKFNLGSANGHRK